MSLFGGKYSLGMTLGRGGMGVVYEALEVVTGKIFAIKVVSRAAVDELLMARLLREAEAARRIASSHVPELFEVDTTNDGELFLVMERLYGETLAQRLKKRRGFLPWSEVRAFGDDILCGLIDAHAAGVVHRDLKPSNIFVERAREGDRERAKVLDFGVCKLDGSEALTVTGEAVGTVAYMAPEQIRGASKVDPRADLYAFGMLVFEALSGKLAHDASGQMAMIASKLERPARALHEAAEVELPEGLDALIAQCLARKPEARPVSAAALQTAWRGLGEATVAPTPAPPPPPLTSLSPLPPKAALEFHDNSKNDTLGLERTWTRIALVVAAVTLIASAVVLFLALRGRS